MFTDHQVASTIMFVGASLFLLGVLVALPTSHQDTNNEAKTVQITMDLIHSTFVFTASIGFLYLSFTDGWYALHYLFIY